MESFRCGRDFAAWLGLEAYAPELVEKAVQESRIPVRRALDPFGGSGTTALACQFLGVHPTTVEVNPFLADLIEAKLTRYDADALARDLGRLASERHDVPAAVSIRLRQLPPTFVQPGINDRWIFDREVAIRIATLLQRIEGLSTASHQRLFKVLLGGIVIDVSNVVVSGNLRITATANPGVGADAGVPPPIRFRSSIAKLVRKRLAIRGSDIEARRASPPLVSVRHLQATAQRPRRSEILERLLELDQRLRQLRTTPLLSRQAHGAKGLKSPNGPTFR